MGIVTAPARTRHTASPGSRGLHLSLCALACWAQTALSQTSTAETSEPIALFSLLNLVKADGPLKVQIGNKPVGIGEMPYGFYTGFVNWYPASPVSLEAKGFTSVTIPTPNKSKPSSTVPLFVVYDTVKPPAPNKEPVPVIEWKQVPEATDRADNYLDAINFSSLETLEAMSGSSKILLPKGKRVRISSKSASSLRILPQGPEIMLSPPEDDSPSRLLAIFYSLPNGTIDYSIASEPEIQQ